ncbi:MAG: PilZ domain-containing protein [Desulfobulbaceae bacterium]|nr:PilZ domain-containing protein [Desulfobulbaceae bacterium]
MTAVDRIYCDRRKHKRFQVNGHAVAFSSIDFGRIIDISIVGLAFMSDFEDGSAYTPNFLDIVHSDNDFCMKVPVKRTSVSKILLPCRRSVQFGTLSSSQAEHLNFFISNFTARG